MYVCPSRWQRIRLRWAFRHFHVLPPQVLSRRDQRLIEKLARSALVTPALPVAPDRVFGVVENVRWQSTPSTRQVVPLKTERLRPQALQAKARISDLPRPDLPHLDLPDRKRLFAVSSGSIPIRPTGAPKHAARERGARFVRDARFQQWGALGMLVAVCTCSDTAAVLRRPSASRNCSDMGSCNPIRARGASCDRRQAPSSALADSGFTNCAITECRKTEAPARTSGA